MEMCCIIQVYKMDKNHMKFYSTNFRRNILSGLIHGCTEQEIGALKLEPGRQLAHRKNLRKPLMNPGVLFYILGSTRTLVDKFQRPGKTCDRPRPATTSERLRPAASRHTR